MDFEKACFNMVEQQIRPRDVLDFDILDVLKEIGCEHFVDKASQGLAYTDMELPLANGHKMLEPKVVARLTQGLKLEKDEAVLEIGTNLGYTTALLSRLAGEVTIDDIDTEQQQRAKKVLDESGFANVDYVQNNGLTEASQGAPFDAIYVDGTVGSVSEILREQLKDGGRTVIIVGRKPVRHALLLTRNGNEFSERVLFDTVVAHLEGKSADLFGDFDF